MGVATMAHGAWPPPFLILSCVLGTRTTRDTCDTLDTHECDDPHMSHVRIQPLWLYKIIENNNRPNRTKFSYYLLSHAVTV